MGFRQNIFTWDRNSSRAQQQLLEACHKARLHPLEHDPIDCIVTTGDLVFHAGYRHLIKDGLYRAIVFVDGPPHKKDKLLDRDADLTRLIESPSQMLKSKIIRVQNWEGGLLSQKDIEEALDQIREWVEPIKK